MSGQVCYVRSCLALVEDDSTICREGHPQPRITETLTSTTAEASADPPPQDAPSEES